MQYLNRAMHEKGYQESSVRRLSRPSQGSVVFRHNDSAGHHIKTALDLSGTTTQSADPNVKWEFSFQRKSSSIYMRVCTADSCLKSMHILKRTNRYEHISSCEIRKFEYD
ncbi:hypothetical protein F511_38112 [Dorcoceras hygrometricum]|uniref:Uncharacterized protein n=1 Tax=Dorcoceras hygrometricum TaxID=472368 RepID=A0A2Z7A2D1_9LAMI|nr:hypothetical protein F511_38112 [Dorcoceras hygrometricum]